MSKNGHDDQLEALREELHKEREARARAEADSEQKSAMVATVAHELRTPLGAIISMADLLQTTPLDRTQRHYCETLQQSARGLLSVLNDLLDLAKLKAGRMELNPEDLDLDGFLVGIDTILRARARDKGLETHLKRKPGLPHWIRIDQMRLRQVISNLTDNAVKFTDKGSVTLTADFDFHAEGVGMLRIEVADTGPGITPKLKQKLFEPYEQGSGAVAGHHGGTGLGLSIVRDLVRLMGGSIGCDARPGKGARFWFEVPCEALGAPATVLSPRKGETFDIPPTQASGRHLLVIEDNKINQTLIGVFLDKFGMSYVMASRGEDAVKAVQEERFDAILMDIRMNGLDGFETTRRIRALGADYQDIPIIALTAYAKDEDGGRCLAAGMNDYVTKPIEPRDLFLAIENAITGTAAGLAEA